MKHSLASHIIGPLWLRIPEKRRWTIVGLLDKSRRRCWADLVDDALACREDDACDIKYPRLKGNRAPRCASVCDWSHPEHRGIHDCSCYCGKFQFAASDGGIDRKEASR